LPPDVLLFDLDGTLVDSAADITSAANHAMVQIGREPLSEAIVRSYIGNGLAKLIERCLGDDQRDHDRAVQAFRAYYRDHLTDQTRLYPGWLERLERWHRDRRMGVVSNKPSDFTRKLIDELGVARFFAALAGGDAYLEKKPSPVPILEVLRALDGSPARAIMIGDGDTDMRAGRAAGVPTCGVLWGYTSEAVLREAGADFVVRTLDELAALIDG